MMRLRAFRIMAVFIMICFLLFEGAGTVVQAEPGSSKSSEEEELEQQKKDVLAPKPPRKPRKTKKQKIQELIQTASKSGLKPEEIAERLGLAQTEE